MVYNTQEEHVKSIDEIHRYYMNIINCMPHIVYWVDSNCMLKGCNNNFVKLLGLNSSRDLLGTPYDQLIKFAAWTPARVEALRLDDMSVIFSGKAQHRMLEAPIETSHQRVPLPYLATRIPIVDQNKHVTHLVVTLEEAASQKLQNGRETVDNCLIAHTASTLCDSFTESIIPATNSQNIDSQPNYQASFLQSHSYVTAEKIPGVRALIVEDNYIAQKVGASLLEQLGCVVDVAASGDEALKQFMPGKYHIIFLDIGLEDTSGYIVAKRIRELEKNTHFYAPIIALTSYRAEVIKDDCHEYSMDGVITKPLTREQAKQIMERFVYHQNVAIRGLC